ncbi:MAG: hypothetical protein JSS36_06350 [Proteobacteria bacterium]|nr:hypothetical protein [Pseudomonadota bacterium]
MGPGETIGLAAVVIGAIAIIGILSDLYKRHLAFKERQLELMASHTAEKAAQYATANQALEDRVRVLERIATDRGGDLAQAIEQLRGPAAN